MTPAPQQSVMVNVPDVLSLPDLLGVMLSQMMSHIMIDSTAVTHYVWLYLRKFKEMLKKSRKRYIFIHFKKCLDIKHSSEIMPILWKAQ